MDKKGASLSINVIIVAIIALLVLVILVVMYMNNMIGFNKGIADCENKGGTCYPTAADCPTGYDEYPSWSCADVSGVSQHCCIGTS